VSADGERPVVSDLRAAKDAQAKGRAKSLLPSKPPPPGAPREEEAAWLTVALHLGSDPLRAVERYGSHVDARTVAVTENGRRITFERTADVFDPSKLVQVVMTATGAQLPPYSKADAQQIAGSMIRLSDLLAEDDLRGEAIGWGQSFLEGAAGNAITASDFASPHGRWEALSLLATWKPDSELPPYTPAAQRSALVIDGATGDRLVRTSDFAAHARGETGRPLSWAALHGRMVEVGWDHRGEVQQRQPNGQDKRKLHVYVVEARWEHS
jgi:hypothetical protein